jgi:hypothetical protein
MNINFFKLEKNILNNNWMLFAKFSNMPQTCYSESKSNLLKIKTDLNRAYNLQYIKENKPTLN